MIKTGIYPSVSDKIRYAVDTNANSSGSVGGYLSKSFPLSSAKTFTISLWIKLDSSAAAMRRLVGTGDGTAVNLQPYFNLSYTDTNISVTNNAGGTTRTHSFTVTDMNNGAWHHIFVQVDTTQATDTNRVKVWLDNVAQTSASGGSGYFTLDQSLQVGSGSSWKAFHYTSLVPSEIVSDIKCADLYILDGLTPAVTRFVRSTKSGLRPIKYRGPYGTNGTYLQFLSSTISAAGIGANSGNAGNWTPVTNTNALVQITDTPSG